MEATPQSFASAPDRPNSPGTQATQLPSRGQLVMEATPQSFASDPDGPNSPGYRLPNAQQGAASDGSYTTEFCE